MNIQKRSNPERLVYLDSTGGKVPVRLSTRFSVLLMVLFLLVVAGCAEQAPSETATEVPRNVRVLALSHETINEYFEISGPVSPVRGADLSAQESGPIVAIPVAKGSEVLSGVMIIEQERKILKAERDAAAAALKAQAYNVDKVRRLHEAGKVSRIELLTAESTHAQTKALADVTAERYRRAGIRAPFDGVIVDRYVELGQLVAPGTLVARVIDPYTLKLEAYLTDEQVRWVKPGEQATILLGDAVETAVGKVAWVGFEADRLTGKFKVEIEIPNPNLKLRSGVIGRARIGKNTVRDVVVVPRDAILSGRVGPTAYVVENDRAVLRQLTLGASQGIMVVVLSGLQMGDQLVVRGQRELREDSLIKITEQSEAADGSLARDPGTVTRAEVGSRIPAAGVGQTKTLGDGDVEARK